jgi:hypothetical protein
MPGVGFSILDSLHPLHHTRVRGTSCEADVNGVFVVCTRDTMPSEGDQSAQKREMSVSVHHAASSAPWCWPTHTRQSPSLTRRAPLHSRPSAARQARPSLPGGGKAITTPPYTFYRESLGEYTGRCVGDFTAGGEAAPPGLLRGAARPDGRRRVEHCAWGSVAFSLHKYRHRIIFVPPLIQFIPDSLTYYVRESGTKWMSGGAQ